MIIWFTGQPGAGKSTLANALGSARQTLGYRVAAIDGEAVRRQTGNDDYSDAGRILNVRRGQQRAAELAANGLVVMASFVSPHRAALTNAFCRGAACWSSLNQSAGRWQKFSGSTASLPRATPAIKASSVANISRVE
jgi:hypothetical protein